MAACYVKKDEKESPGLVLSVFITDKGLLF